MKFDEFINYSLLITEHHDVDNHFLLSVFFF